MMQAYAATSGRVRRFAAALGVLGLAAATPLAAQVPTAAAETITLEQAMRIALERNAALRLARNANALDALDVRQQRMQFLPDLQFSTRSTQNFGRSFNEAEGRIVTSSTQVVNAGISSSVVLFDGLRNVASLREAQLAEQAGEAAVDRARQTVVFDVLSSFLALLEQQEQLRVRRENLAAQEAEARRIGEYVDAGARPISDLYQQQAQVASARLAVVEAARGVELSKVALMQILQLDPRGNYQFEAPPAVVDTTAPPLVLDSLLERAFARRADLEAQEALVNSAEQGVRAAKAGVWPTISLSAGYNSNYTSASEFGFFDQFDQRRGGSVGIGLSFPLFDRRSTSIASQRAEIQEENARIALENLRQEVGLQVRRVYLDYQAAQEQLRAAEAQLRAADLALETSLERYEVGAATVFELTQARAAQVQAASALVRARYNLRFQERLIGYYTGELDPERL